MPFDAVHQTKESFFALVISISCCPCPFPGCPMHSTLEECSDTTLLIYFESQRLVSMVCIYIPQNIWHSPGFLGAPAQLLPTWVVRQQPHSQQDQPFTFLAAGPSFSQLYLGTSPISPSIPYQPEYGSALVLTFFFVAADHSFLLSESIHPAMVPLCRCKKSMGWSVVSQLAMAFGDQSSLQAAELMWIQRNGWYQLVHLCHCWTVPPNFPLYLIFHVDSSLKTAAWSSNSCVSSWLHKTFSEKLASTYLA